MTDWLQLNPAPTPALTEPLRVAPLTNSERFDLAYEAEQATARSFPAERNYRLAFDAAAEAFRAQGVHLENPFTDLASPYRSGLGAALTGRTAPEVRAEQERRLAAWDAAAERLREANPDALDTFPTSAELRAQADVRAAQAFRANQAAVGAGGGLGAFAGTVVGALQDPVQAAGLFLGAPWRGVTSGASLAREVARVAAVDAAVGAATQAAIETSAAPFRARLGVEGDAATSIAAAAVGSALLGGGLRGVVGGFELRGVRARAASAEASPADVAGADVQALTQQRLAELAGNPGGPERTGAHERALDRATFDTAAGRATPATLPAPAPDVPPAAARGFVERMMADGAPPPAPAMLGDLLRLRPDDARLAELSAALRNDDPAARAQAEAELAGRWREARGDLATLRFHTFTPSGRAVLVEPQLVELDSLVPSHLDEGGLNPAYPHAEGVQPRDRGAAPSQDQIRAIAAGLIPERLAPNVEAGFGAPIVADDLVVESGNGRVLALRQVYGREELAETRAAYRAFLEARGFAVEGMRQPVLISRRISALTPEQRRAFVAEANGRATLAQNIAERARADAARLDDALDLWRGGDVDSLDNAPFVRAFLAGLTAEERGSLLTSAGRLSAEGSTRLRAAILARAYGDEMGPLLERFLEGRTEGLRSIAGALTDAAARWAQLRRSVAQGEVDTAMDITADLIGAVRMLDEARRQDVPLVRLLAQEDLDRPPLTDVARAVLASFYRGPSYTGGFVARPAIAARLDGFVEEALKVRPGPDLFGSAPLRPGEVFEQARLRRAPEAEAATPQGDAPSFRFQDDAPPPDPYAQRQAALRAAVAEQEASRPAPQAIEGAELLEARRVAAERDVPVADGAPDEAGLQPVRGARELLDEADSELADAQQAAACLIGTLL
jgi:hypothetical protein